MIVINTQFFLGANTHMGFKSLFNELYDPDDDWKMFIIKGGPGTGKSSLMKAVAKKAEKLGYDVETIPCSSDPYSLDAVIIPQLRISMADGTSPHIIDPVFPGVCEEIINLGEYWNREKLSENKNKIKSITKENSDKHKKCIDYLRTAALADKEIYTNIINCIDENKINNFINRTLKSFMIKQNKEPIIRKRFLSAVTPIGIAVQYDSIYSLCDKIYCIDDKYGVVSRKIMESLKNNISEYNYDLILCYCAFDPDKLEHIIIPELKLGFFTSNMYHPSIRKPFKNIHFERFTDKSKLIKKKEEINFAKKTKFELIGESIKKLEEAKIIHDTLESYYISAMDFGKIAEITNNIINECFT